MRAGSKKSWNLLFLSICVAVGTIYASTYKTVSSPFFMSDVRRNLY